MTAATTVVDHLQHRRWLADQTDWIAASSRATELGRRARRAYLDRNQVSNLQRVAETAAAVSTLLDYIKTQTGKQPLWRRENFGPMLLDDLERLHARAGHAVPASGNAHVELCRVYIRQVVAAYSYSIAVDVTAPRIAAPPPRPAAPAPDIVRPPRQRGPRAGGTRAGRAGATEAASGADESLTEANASLPDLPQTSMAVENGSQMSPEETNPDTEPSTLESPEQEGPSERFEQHAADDDRTSEPRADQPPEGVSRAEEDAQ